MIIIGCLNLSLGRREHYFIQFLYFLGFSYQDILKQTLAYVTDSKTSSLKYPHFQNSTCRCVYHLLCHTTWSCWSYRNWYAQKQKFHWTTCYKLTSSLSKMLKKYNSQSQCLTSQIRHPQETLLYVVT